MFLPDTKETSSQKMKSRAGQAGPVENERIAVTNVCRKEKRGDSGWFVTQLRGFERKKLHRGIERRGEGKYKKDTL